MTYCLTDISPAFQIRVDDLRTCIRGETLYKHYLGSVLDGLQGEIEYIDVLLNALLEAQRLLMIHDAGVHMDQAFFDYYTSNNIPSWQKQNSPPVARDLIESLAAKIYNMRPGEGDYGLLHIGDNVRSVVEVIFKRLIDEKELFDVTFADPVFKAILLNHTEENGIKALAERTLKNWDMVTRRMVVVPGLPQEEIPEVDDGKDKLLQSLTKPIHERVMNGEIHYTLTAIPTEKDAELDNIPYEDYLNLFFEMCDQPWEYIDKAHRFLIKKLNNGNELRFTNNDGTDVSMSIDGMTFANSLIARNVPGSEVFSAPLKDSVNGKIVANGVFSAPGNKGEKIEDIEMTFEQGKVTHFSAAIGEDLLREEIETDEGSCYTGEIGIGTNPHLKRHVSNGLLVEKIGGSFHVALGNAYTATEYLGEPVKFDNGNRSLIHWDITTMLHGKSGKIYLDGDLLMDDGQFLDTELDVLNRGWEAVPVEKRPEYWKNYDFQAKSY